MNPENGEVLVKENEFITEELANKIAKANIREVSIRSVFSCRSKVGVCAKCYGKNMATTLPVQVGESGRSGRHHCRAVHRRTRHAAYDAYVPYGRHRGYGRYYARSSPC